MSTLLKAWLVVFVYVGVSVSGGIPNVYSSEDSYGFVSDLSLKRYSPDTVGPGGIIMNSNLTSTEINEDAFMALVDLDRPGSMNLPHTHPRSSEIVLVTKGIIRLGVICAGKEYGYPPIKKEIDLPAHSAGFVPKSCVHYELNVGKSKAQFAAFFHHYKPGVFTFPQALLKMDLFKKKLEKIDGSQKEFGYKLEKAAPKNIAELSKYACEAQFPYDYEYTTQPTHHQCGYDTISDRECLELGCCYRFMKDENGASKPACMYPFSHTIDAIGALGY
mmetsp:Transcript_2115/g.2198  ORF Transcript_2115/g.2198 Transcript_2115/m.2198 type:complete len:275 (+) Transcript_2115:74-898(+)